MAKIAIYGPDGTTVLKVVRTEGSENENDEDYQESREHKALKSTLMLGILEKMNTYSNRFA